MLNGRHLLLLGGIATAGLLSVREGERQTGLGYRMATVEKEIRAIRGEIKLCKTEHLALQSPKAVMDRAAQLHLPLAPVAPAAPTQQQTTQRAATNRIAPPLPQIPTIPGLSPSDRP